MVALLREPAIATEVGALGTEPVVGDIRREWDWVKEGVRVVLANSPNQRFRAEDVYTACITGDAQLWITSEGFTVTTEERDVLAQETFCYIWIAWAKNRGNAYVIKHQEFFEREAMLAGFDGLKLRTDQLGLKDYLARQNWELETVEFTRRFNGKGSESE
jgi:hypothetical protein